MGIRNAYARNADLSRFQAKARRGEIPDRAVTPLAVVFAASRNAQIAIGPGYHALDAILEAFPPIYVENWMNQKRRRAA